MTRYAIQWIPLRSWVPGADEDDQPWSPTPDVVQGSEADADEYTGPNTQYWLDVYLIPDGPPMPQMYRVGEILGVPALGLHMDGAPDPVIRIRS